jgi:mannose-6-phosphate isomerase
MPEDWLASVVRALNGEHSQGPEEGLSRISNADGSAGPLLTDLLKEHADTILGKDHTSRYGTSMGILCKFLDSTVRLPVQCHPDKTMAKEHYNSIYGKTESWYILDTRAIDGEPPYILLGFKESTTRDGFTSAVMSQDIRSMEGMLHKIPVTPGEMYFIPGRLPHAIGPGVFMLETQEPSDWVIRAERHCGNATLSDRDMWGPLAPEQALRIFDCRGCSEAVLIERVRMKNEPVARDASGEIVELVGRRQTEAFSVRRATVSDTMTMTLPRSFGVVVVTSGSGTIRWQSGRRKIRRGDYFLHPAVVEQIEYVPDEPLTLAICLPPAS